MIPSLAVDHHPECGVPKDLDWIMDIWRRQRLLIDKCSSAIVASGIAGSDHRDWQPQALAMATTGTGTSQSIIQSVSDTTSTGSSCTPLSHSVQQCLSCQVVLDRMILSGGSVEVLMDIIQSALSGNTSGPSLCVDTGGGGSSVGCRSSGHGARGKEPRVRFPPWAIFSLTEGERGWVDWPEPAPRGSWIIAELCKWKIDCVG